MATLSKHGQIGQIERLTFKVAYCHDGQILRNQGDGWKVWKRLKPEFASDPVGAFERAKARYAEKLATRPEFAAWRSMLHELVSFSHRWMVVTAIEMMPQDPDGVWSTLDDYSTLGIDLSIEDCVQLCRAYEAASAEAKAAQPEPASV